MRIRASPVVFRRRPLRQKQNGPRARLFVVTDAGSRFAPTDPAASRVGGHFPHACVIPPRLGSTALLLHHSDRIERRVGYPRRLTLHLQQRRQQETRSAADPASQHEPEHRGHGLLLMEPPLPATQDWRVRPAMCAGRSRVGM